MTKIALIAFAGASNWPLFAGQKLGVFAEHGIDLAVALTANSRQMARELHQGRVQIALTSVDNVIAYVEGHGEEPLDGKVDFFAFMGVDDGLLSVMAQPGIATIADLKGRTLAVDAKTTGFAFVLREILTQAGLRDEDVTYAMVGTGAERLAALNSGACDATLLNAPLCLAAESSGHTRLMRAKDSLGGYQGIVGATKRQWANENPGTLRAFIKAFHVSLSWLARPENKVAAIEMLAERMPNLSKSLDLAYEVLITHGGLTRTLEIDHAGVAKVIELRRRYSTHAEKPLKTPGAYIDDSYRMAALG
jgi:ABC-type nitrate/sulfonate/bicarbonate transport system substrate-binding protein